MLLEKYSFGIGDRFARQGTALLQAVINAKNNGFEITPVWNKSHREHLATKTSPSGVRAEAGGAVAALNFKGPYRVDADHINLKNVDLFLDSCDFFTIDVADFISAPVDQNDIDAFVKKYHSYTGAVTIPRIDKPFNIAADQVAAAAGKYLPAVKQAAKIYRRIEKAKGAENFITEISLDETDQPQTPIELFFILVAVADEKIPAQTIAPKFSGRFNKGVDYIGDVKKFEEEFQQDLAVIAFAIKQFDLPSSLKLSLHSGSDKFSIYPAINKALKKFGEGLHVKTAGTTWLEELTGLALAHPDSLKLVKKIYAKAVARFDELCAPYAAVISIDKKALPSPYAVNDWTGEEFAEALRHDQSCGKYNPNLRQLLHVAYKIAAEMGTDYLNALEKYEKIISQNVTENIYQRHIKPVFME
jgi:hypothetical protein